MNWDHPEGFTLEEIVVDNEYKGVVTNQSSHGVFIDIGAERNVRLNAPIKEQKMIRRGDVLTVKVSAVDMESRRVAVVIEDLDAALAENRRPVADLTEGARVNGVVSDKGQYGTFVNIGAEREARLAAPTRLARMLARGQVLKGLIVQKVDLELQRVSVALEDFDDALSQITFVNLQEASSLHTSDAPKKVQAPRAAQGKGKGKGKGEKPKEEVKPVEKKPEVVAKEFQVKEGRKASVGSFVNGLVTGISPRGVLLDLGEGVSGSLNVSADLRAQFQVGDEVHGMKVEKITARGLLILSMDSPELEEVDEEPVVVEEKPKTKAKGKGRAGQAPTEAIKEIPKPKLMVKSL